MFLLSRENILSFGMIVLILCFVGLCVSSPPPPEVRLDQGLLRGGYTKTIGGKEVASFLGIPYAKPTTGENRFKESEPADHWTGVYNATRSPPECLQYDHFMYKTPFAVHGSEDCLYLNVFTPQVPKDEEESKLLDVIAFIHGGAFMMMSSTFFEPTILLDRDVVFVTFNYRLGPLGFLSTEDETVPGNNGLKDQVLALKWVQRNIKHFGGNPKSVTLAGMSAGGASVHYHLLSPLSEGLFHKAIIMSGTSLNPWTQTEQALEKSRFLGSQLGCPTNCSKLMIDCLRDRPAQHIVALSKHLMKWLYIPYAPFGPVVDSSSKNPFISKQPIDILNNKLSKDIPILASFAADEGIYPAAEILQEDNLNFLKNNWDELLPHILDYNYTVPDDKRISIGEEIKNRYKVDLNEKEGRKNFIKMVGDRLYVHDIIKAVKIHTLTNKSPIYLYRFSYKGKNSGTSFFLNEDIGISHGDDLFYILYSDKVNTQETEEDKQMSKKMVNLWLTFAANGKLPDPWLSVKNGSSQVSLTDIRGSDEFIPKEADNLGVGAFWDSLGLRENIEQASCPFNV